jgi:methionyl-tRNA formyltransferase
MRISILCSDPRHPIQSRLERWAEQHRGAHDVSIVQRASELSGGDLIFLISCHEIIGREITERYAKSLVIHASDVPNRRGWSPHIWSVLAGEKQIVVSLLEAADGIDTGMIWTKKAFNLEGHELYDEINTKLFDTEIELMDFALSRFIDIVPRFQDKAEGTYCRKRTPDDSRIDIDRSIRDQFDLLRVCDPERYPAFFEKDGFIFELTLKKRKGPVRKKKPFE